MRQRIAFVPEEYVTENPKVEIGNPHRESRTLFVIN